MQGSTFQCHPHTHTHKQCKFCKDVHVYPQQQMCKKTLNIVATT